MDMLPSESSSSERPPTLLSLALLLGGILLYFVVWDMLDPPPTWTRCPHPSAPELGDLSARRDDFLRLAIPLVTTYAVLLGSCAWRWAANRRARQGYRRSPGRLAGGAAVVLTLVWGVLIGHAFTGDAVGGAIFWGIVIAAAGAVLSGVLAIGVLVGLFRSGRRSRADDTIDSLSVGLTWSLLLFALPLFLVGIAVAGKDTTIFC